MAKAKSKNVIRLAVCLTCVFMLLGFAAQVYPQEWWIQIADSIPNVSVGYHNSIALGNNNLPRFSYYNSTYRNLRYAHWKGFEWFRETVDSTGDVGKYSSLALDTNNYAHISYYDATNGDLKYAMWTGTSWDIQIVDSTGDVGLYSSIALDSNDKPHISYHDESNGTLKYVHWTGAIWDIQTVDSGAVFAGRNCSLALDSSNFPHICYFSDEEDWPTSYDQHLKYARWTGSGWDITSIKAEGAEGDDGYTYYPSLGLDSNDMPHVCFIEEYWQTGTFDPTKLYYAKWMGSSWDIQILDINLGDRRHVVCSMAIDGLDSPHKVDQYAEDITYVRWTGSEWSFQILEKTDWIKKSVSIDLDDQNFPHISIGDGELKYARLSQAQIEDLWPISDSFPGGTATLWAKVKNTHSSALPSNTSVWFWIDGPGWSGSNWVGTVNVPGLAAGASQWYSFNWAIPSDATIGEYTYKAQVYLESMPLSPMSGGQTFSIVTAEAPGMATLTSPYGTIADTTPTYNWEMVPGATWYYLWVNGPSGIVIQQWYDSLSVTSGSTCSVTPYTTLAPGNHTWWVRAWNTYGYGPWSSGMSFTLGGSAQVLSLWPVSGATPGAKALLWAQVKNTGTSALSAKVWFWVTGPGWSDTHWVGSAAISGLAVGSSYWYYYEWNIPPSATPGLYSYWAIVYSGSVAISSWSSRQDFTLGSDEK